MLTVPIKRVLIGWYNKIGQPLAEQLSPCSPEQPGRWAELTKVETSKPLPKKDLAEDLLGKVPGSVLKPLAENDILAVID